jgi:hypothetical protein
MSVTVYMVETRPELDPFKRDTGGETYTAVKVDPSDRTVYATQEWHDNATPMEEWLDRIVVFLPAIRPDEDELRSLLESDEGQRLLDAICDGHSIEWDGNNMVGVLTDDASAALDELTGLIDALPETDWELWSVEDWLQQADLGITAQTTDAELSAMAEEIEREATQDHRILSGDVAEYLRQERERLSE